MRYVYDPVTQQWGCQYVRLRLLHPNRGLSQDDFHVYFACDLLLIKGCPVRMPTLAKDGSGTGDPTHGGAIATVSAADAEILTNAQRYADRRKAAAFLESGSPSSFTGAAESNRYGADVYKVIPMVARLYRHNIQDVTDADYFGAGQAQALAESLAYKFSRYPVPPGVRKVPLPLLTNRNVCRIDVLSLPTEIRSQSKGFFSYVTNDSRDIVMLLEPDVRECGAVGISFSTAMPDGDDHGNVPNASGVGDSGLVRVNSADHRGRVTSNNSRSTSVVSCYPFVHEDDVYPPFDTTKYDKTDLKQVADAFSHFSLNEYKGRLMVHGLLCLHHYLVDPLVYTIDEQGFGMGNDGPKAIQHWRAMHRCNDMCRALGLTSLNDLPGQASVTRTTTTTTNNNAQKEKGKTEKKSEKHRHASLLHPHTTNDDKKKEKKEREREREREKEKEKEKKKAEKLAKEEQKKRAKEAKKKPVEM